MSIKLAGKGTKAFVIISGDVLDKQLKGFNELKNNWQLETGIEEAIKV